jgi:tetratricopeptide (TPR) repeat protein
VGITILAPAMGGSVQLWAQALLAILVGALFFVAPPRKFLGWFPTLLFLGVGLAALISFLPAPWFPLPDWRAEFSRLGISLPQTVTPQPWLTIESAGLLWLGLAWAYYLCVCEWPASIREKAWDAFAFGILSLAAMMMTAYAIHTHVPFWPVVKEYGFFPNRNQTSNVLGLAGIMIYANAFQHLQRGQKSGWWWLASLALICWALIQNYSRSGILLFFAGALGWHIWWLVSEREGGRTKILAWGPLAVLIALLLAAGGETLVRFKDTAETLSIEDGRILIFRDATGLFMQSPVVGIGLGNFRSLFSAHRQLSFSSSEAIHPESDWIWLAVEMGALVPVILFGLIIWWIRACWPLDAGSWRRMRVAALICGCAFIAHGFFDVSGHRPGSLWPALFLAATALSPARSLRASSFVAPSFRLLGALFIAGGMWCALSLGNFNPAVPSADLARSIRRLDLAADRENYQEMFDVASAALQVAPLNWELYFKRGFAAAALYRPRNETSRDFAAARYLLPNWADLYLKQGHVWLAVGEPSLAFQIWREAMERSPVLAKPVYAGAFAQVKDDTDLRERWRKLGELKNWSRLSFLHNATPTEFVIEMERILSEDPDLQSFTPTEQKGIFRVWYERGGKLALLDALNQHPAWQKIAWREMAQSYGDYQDYRQACETVTRLAPRPQLPETPSPDAIPDLRARFRSGKNAQDAGLSLAMAQAKNGELDDALRILQMLAADPKPLPAVHFVQGELWAQKGDYQKAWQAFSKYVSSIP